MAEPTDLPDRVTLRYWPWLAMCAVGIAAFGLLAWLALLVALDASAIVVRVIAGLIALGLAVLTVYTLLSLRTRSVLDREGSTTHGPVSSSRVLWQDVERLDVIHFLPGWAIRAWTGDRASIVYLCNDTHGRRPKASTHGTPPPEAPKALHTGYVLVHRYWRAVRDSRQPTHD